MEQFVAGWQKIFDYSGRASRSDYWYFQLFNLLFGIVLSSFIISVVDQLILIMPVYYILLVLANISLTARRLHDVDKSGWFQLISFIPLVGPIWLLVLMVTKGTEGKNRFGEDPLAR